MTRVQRLVRSRAFPFLVLALTCLALALAMSVSMSAIARRFGPVDWLAFAVMSGYVVFMLAFLFLLDRERADGAGGGGAHTAADEVGGPSPGPEDETGTAGTTERGTAVPEASERARGEGDEATL